MNDVVLVGVDGSSGSDTASRWTAAVAAAYGAEVIAVHAVPPWLGSEFGLPPVDMSEFLENVRAELETTWAAPFRAQGTEVRTVLFPADAPAAIMSVAGEEDPRLIVLGAHGHSRWAPRHIGGVPSKVLHGAKWPIAVVPHPTTGADPAGGPVLVGIDGSAASRRALQWAVGHARRLHVAVHALAVIVREIWTLHEPQLARFDGIDPAGETYAVLRDFVAGAIGIEAASDVHCEVVMGHPIEELTSPDRAPSLLVVGGSGHSRLGELALGSVSRGCVARSNQPVVCVP